MHVILSVLDVVSLLLLIYFWRLMLAAKREGVEWDEEDVTGVIFATICMIVMAVILLVAGVVAFIVKQPPFIWDYMVFTVIVSTLLCIRFNCLLPHEPPILS